MLAVWLVLNILLASTPSIQPGPPTTLLEFTKKSEIALERITLFKDGVLVLHQEGPGKRQNHLQRQLSKEEVKVYREFIQKIDWSSIPPNTTTITPGPLVEYYELTVELKGKPHTVRGTLLDTFPLQLGNLLTVVSDLRETLITTTSNVHPILDRPPGVGERIVDQMDRVFSVVEIREIDGVYVLRGESVPITYELTLEQIPELFKDYADTRRNP